MLTLHQFVISPFSVKLRRLMHYKGIEFSTKDYALADQAAIKKFNPAAKLPSIEHRNQFVNDSTDIAYYLEQQFPDKPVIPADPGQAALVHILEDWADESLYFYEMRMRFGFPSNAEKNLPKMLAWDKGFVKWFLGKVIPGGLKKILANQGVGRKTEQQVLTDAERHIKAVSQLVADREWLVGDHLTLADLAVYSMLECFKDAQEAQAIMDKYPAVGDWYYRLQKATGGAES